MNLHHGVLHLLVFYLLLLAGEAMGGNTKFLESRLRILNRFMEETSDLIENSTRRLPKWIRFKSRRFCFREIFVNKNNWRYEAVATLYEEKVFMSYLAKDLFLYDEESVLEVAGDHDGYVVLAPRVNARRATLLGMGRAIARFWMLGIPLEVDFPTAFYKLLLGLNVSHQDMGQWKRFGVDLEERTKELDAMVEGVQEVFEQQEVDGTKLTTTVLRMLSRGKRFAPEDFFPFSSRETKSEIKELNEWMLEKLGLLCFGLFNKPWRELTVEAGTDLLNYRGDLEAKIKEVFLQRQVVKQMKQKNLKIVEDISYEGFPISFINAIETEKKIIKGVEYKDYFRELSFVISPLSSERLFLNYVMGKYPFYLRREERWLVEWLEMKGTGRIKMMDHRRTRKQSVHEMEDDLFYSPCEATEQCEEVIKKVLNATKEVVPQVWIRDVVHCLVITEKRERKPIEVHEALHPILNDRMIQLIQYYRSEKNVGINRNEVRYLDKMMTPIDIAPFLQRLFFEGRQDKFRIDENKKYTVVSDHYEMGMLFGYLVYHDYPLLMDGELSEESIEDLLGGKMAEGFQTFIDRDWYSKHTIEFLLYGYSLDPFVYAKSKYGQQLVVEYRNGDGSGLFNLKERCKIFGVKRFRENVKVKLPNERVCLDYLIKYSEPFLPYPEFSLAEESGSVTMYRLDWNLKECGRVYHDQLPCTTDSAFKLGKIVGYHLHEGKRTPFVKHNPRFLEALYTKPLDVVLDCFRMGFYSVYSEDLVLLYFPGIRSMMDRLMHSFSEVMKRLRVVGMEDVLQDFLMFLGVKGPMPVREEEEEEENKYTLLRIEEGKLVVNRKWYQYWPSVLQGFEGQPIEEESHRLYVFHSLIYGHLQNYVAMDKDTMEEYATKCFLSWNKPACVEELSHALLSSLQSQNYSFLLPRFLYQQLFLEEEKKKPWEIEFDLIHRYRLDTLLVCRIDMREGIIYLQRNCRQMSILLLSPEDVTKLREQLFSVVKKEFFQGYTAEELQQDVFGKGMLSTLVKLVFMNNEVEKYREARKWLLYYYPFVLMEFAGEPTIATPQVEFQYFLEECEDCTMSHSLDFVIYLPVEYTPMMIMNEMVVMMTTLTATDVHTSNGVVHFLRVMNNMLVTEEDATFIGPRLIMEDALLTGGEGDDEFLGDDEYEEEEEEVIEEIEEEEIEEEEINDEDVEMEREEENEDAMDSDEEEDTMIVNVPLRRRANPGITISTEHDVTMNIPLLSTSSASPFTANTEDFPFYSLEEELDRHEQQHMSEDEDEEESSEDGGNESLVMEMGTQTTSTRNNRLRIHRHLPPKNFVEQSCLFLKDATVDFKIEYEDMVGSDYGGLFRDWISLMMKYMIGKGPDYNWIPGMMEKKGKEKEEIECLGSLLALSLRREIPLGIVVPSFIWKYLFIPSVEYKLEDVEEDSLRRSLLSLTQIEDDDMWESLDMEYVYSDGTPLTNQRPIPSLNATNVHSYIHDYLEYHFLRRHQSFLIRLSRGFIHFVDFQFPHLIESSLLRSTVLGRQDIPLEEWKKRTEYKDSKQEDTPLLRWFWKCVEKMHYHERKKWYQFVSGLSLFPSTEPVLMVIGDYLEAGDSHFPRAHTCFRTLDLPEYSSFDVLCGKMHAVIKSEDATMGFHIA